MKTITVFTPTYNRKHTIWRTYESMLRQTCHDLEWMIIDDGSTDGTREWVESLGKKLPSSAKPVDWMGRVVEESKSLKVEESKSYGGGLYESAFCIEVPFADSNDVLKITYVYKENGGLYTGYNTAYANIDTELCVCIDSDDYMPDDAVEKILGVWKKHYPNGSQNSNLSALTSQEYCGIVGLDFNVVDKQPIGGLFDEIEHEFYYGTNHSGDTKEVMRTNLMKSQTPMLGFKEEKNFNPFYMLMPIVDSYPIIKMNENLCWVEYQVGKDSMSQGIYKQYINSPLSFSKYRIRQLELKHGLSFIRKMKLHAQLVSSSIFAKKISLMFQSPNRLLTLVMLPAGALLSLYIKYKSKK